MKMSKNLIKAQSEQLHVTRFIVGDWFIQTLLKDIVSIYYLVSHSGYAKEVVNLPEPTLFFSNHKD